VGHLSVSDGLGGVAAGRLRRTAHLLRRRLRGVAARVEHALLARRYGAIVGVETNASLAALTFDDGPHPEVTPRLLELFGRYGAKATHFVVGAAAAARPDLIQAMLRRGHTVANHTFDHPSLVRLSRGERIRQLRSCQEALGSCAEPLMRPPYGHYDLACARDVRALGLRCVTWSAHVEDWRVADAATLEVRLRAAVRPGAIVLLHEALYTTDEPAASDRGPLLAALEAVLAAPPDGLRFVTVPELLEHGPARLRVIRRRGDDAFVAAQRPGMQGHRVSPGDA
jgi:peptidoglycan-N-acetylglucosamine deacetylase